jgi:hypothetical protein
MEAKVIVSGGVLTSFASVCPRCSQPCAYPIPLYAVMHGAHLPLPQARAAHAACPHWTPMFLRLRCSSRAHLCARVATDLAALGRKLCSFFPSSHTCSAQAYEEKLYGLYLAYKTPRDAAASSGRKSGPCACALCRPASLPAALPQLRSLTANALARLTPACGPHHDAA